MTLPRLGKNAAIRQDGRDRQFCLGNSGHGGSQSIGMQTNSSSVDAVGLMLVHHVVMPCAWSVPGRRSCRATTASGRSGGVRPHPALRIGSGPCEWPGAAGGVLRVLVLGLILTWSRGPEGGVRGFIAAHRRLRR